MAKIRILYVITRLDLGGAQQSLLATLSVLSKNKYEVFLVCGKQGILLDDALSIPNINIKLFASLHREINPFYDLKAFIDLYRFINNNDIDIVHTHSSKAGIIGRWAAKLAGVPVISHTIHGWEFYPGQNFFARNFYIFLERITAKITHKLIAVSNYDIQQGLNHGIGNAKKYALIRYGIKRSDFSLPSLDIQTKKKELGINPSSFIVGMIACFKPQKSPQDFIRAASLVTRSLPETKFILVGDGILRNKLQRLIKKLNLTKNVTLLGWRRDIDELIRIFDILVLTSRWEGLPVVFLEAMAASKPIIATSVCGNSEIIKDRKNGFLILPGDYYALSEKITPLLKNKNLRAKLGNEGFHSLDNTFETDYMVSQLERIYTQVNPTGG